MFNINMIKTYCKNPLLTSEFNNLPKTSNLEISIVDDKSLEIIMRIKDLLCAFEPMGYDELRYLYIESVRGEIDDWCTYDEFRRQNGGRMKAWKKEWSYRYPNSKQWHEVGIRYHNQLVFLFITRRYRDNVIIGNTKDCYTPREQVTSYRYDVSAFLTKLEKYLTSVIEAITADPEGYIRYLEDNYPYRMRSGKIASKDWCRITKEKLLVMDGETYSIIQKVSRMKPEAACMKLTLNEYMRVWKIAYTALPRHQHLKDSSLAEVFRHSSKGDLRLIRGYDWDSEADFQEWENENSPYHCYDVCYARVHLFAQSVNGSRYLELAAHYEGWIEELICIAVALYKAGVPFVLRDADELLTLHDKNGTIAITPEYQYGRSIIKNPDRHLPSIGKNGISRRLMGELITTIQWERFQEVKPIKK